VRKTALLEHAVVVAPTLRVIRVTKMEREMELAFAGCTEHTRAAGRRSDHRRERSYRQRLHRRFGTTHRDGGRVCSPDQLARVPEIVRAYMPAVDGREHDELDLVGVAV
jgi:hypothetical protein